MDTRSGKTTAKPLSEAELETIRAKIAAETQTLREERARFEREKETSLRTIDGHREELAQREMEVRKREESMTTTLYDQSTSRELDNLRQETKRLQDRPATGPRAPFPATNESYSTVSAYHDDRDEIQIPKISFREALETVPIFDGYNMSVSQFARACRRAKDIVPPSSERNLTRLLCNKLRGRALVAVEDEPCHNVTHLIDLLTTAFGPQKTIEQYRGELSTIYLGPREHILDYISRVKDLRSSILDGLRREGENVNARTAEIDALTARSFCDGLPWEYRLQLKSEHHSKPFEAFTAAKIIAKRAETDKQRYGNPSYSGRSPWGQPVKPLVQSAPPRPFASYENRERPRDNGITYDRSRNFPVTPNRETNRNSPPPNIRNTTDRASKWCKYCKYQGHEIDECRKRQYNNSRSNQQGNGRNPSEPKDAVRADLSRPERPIRIIEASTNAPSASQS